MRKTSLLIALLVLVGFAGGALAQEPQEPVILIPEALPELPSAGLKPGDFFYFLDIWEEAIGEFFTFRAENRARLQAERALERIAEAKVLLEVQGVDAPGLSVAEEKIRQNMAKAAGILEQQKARGIEVAQLAKQLDSEFDVRQDLFRRVLRATKEDLETQERALKAQIREARLAGNFEKVGELKIRLINIRAQKNRMDIRKDFLGEIFEIEEERIKTGMEAKEKELETLAEEAEDLFNQRENSLERAFGQRERVLEFQEKALEIQLRQAILDGDTVLAEQIRTKLLNLETQEESLEAEEEALEESLGQEKEKLKRAVAMRERAVEQIEEAKEELLVVKEEIARLAEALPTVSELVVQAENKLVLAEQAFAEEKYGQAFGQAMAAEKLARNAGRILEEKGETAEKLKELGEEIGEANQVEEVLREVQRRFEQASMEEREELRQEVEEARKQYQERLKEIERVREQVGRVKERRLERLEAPELPRIPERIIPPELPRMPERPGNNQGRGRICQEDRDCLGLICPMVVGGDTPQCNEEIERCFCGPSWTADNGMPNQERPEIPRMPGMPIPEIRPEMIE